MKPKVLVAAPVSSRHGHLVADWVRNVNKLEEKPDILLIDNTLDGGKFAKKIGRAYNVKVEFHKWIPAKKMLDLRKWEQGYRHHLQMLADCRERYRQYFLNSDKKYTHLFQIDVDVFPRPDYLQKLLNYDKDQVGPVIHVYPNPKEHRACTFHSPKVLIKKKGFDLDYYTFREINEYKKNARLWLEGKLTNGWKPDDPKNPYLHKCYGTSFGSLLIKRKVLEKVPFRTHPTYIHGEDLWYYKEASDKGFESFLDTSYRIEHRNCCWNKVHKTSFEQLMSIRLFNLFNLS